MPVLNLTKNEAKWLWQLLVAEEASGAEEASTILTKLCEAMEER